MSRTVRALAVAAGLLTLLLGLWCFVAPQSFYNQIALWPPYNQHLLHDIGAFQMGIGAALLAGAYFRDGLLVGLIAGAIGSVMHAVAHFIDRGKGGRSTDPAVLGLLALLLVIAAVLRYREVPRR